MGKRRFLSLAFAILLLGVSIVALSYSFSQTILKEKIPYPSYGNQEEMLVIAIIDPDSVENSSASASHRDYYQLSDYLNKKLDRPVQCIYPVAIEEASWLSPTQRIDIVLAPASLPEDYPQDYQRANIRKVASVPAVELPGKELDSYATNPESLGIYVNGSLDERLSGELINAIREIPKDRKITSSMQFQGGLNWEPEVVGAVSTKF